MGNKRRKATGMILLAMLCSVGFVKGVNAETYEYDKLNR